MSIRDLDLRVATFDCYGTLVDWEGGAGGFLYAGRMYVDAGVHALAMSAHVDITKPVAPFRLMEGINAHLRPNPVAIIACAQVADWPNCAPPTCASVMTKCAAGPFKTCPRFRMKARTCSSRRPKAGPPPFKCCAPH
jgi:hypothetical protein